jgi:hypothetical protein
MVGKRTGLQHILLTSATEKWRTFLPCVSPNLVTALKGERKGVLMWSALPIRGEGMLKNE